MARKTPLSSLKQINEINLTPLMDLTFILLITFIITFPLLEQGIPVQLPVGKANDLAADDARTVTVNRDGNVYLDDAPVSLAELTGRIEEVRRFSPEVTVMVRADERVQYASVVGVLRALHEAKVSRLALVTSGEDKDER